MKIFKIQNRKDSHLILRGNLVVNGDYEIELKDENTAFYDGGEMIYWADFVCDVPTGIKGGYRDIMEWFYLSEFYKKS